MLKIETVYAFISVDKDGNEGICGFGSTNDQGGINWTPMVGADLARVEQLRPIVQKIADHSGKTVKLVHFQQRVEVEEIKAQPAGVPHA